MHFVFLTRGHIDYVEPFIKELSTRYLEYDYGKQGKKILKIRLCPIQAWDLSFPKPHLDAVLNTCLNSGKGETIQSSLQKHIWMLRKALGLKKIPEYKKDFNLAMERPQHTEVIAVGIKEDLWYDEKGNKCTEENKTEGSWEGI